jgi:hypothetical protein
MPLTLFDITQRFCQSEPLVVLTPDGPAEVSGISRPNAVIPRGMVVVRNGAVNSSRTYTPDELSFPVDVAAEPTPRTLSLLLPATLQVLQQTPILHALPANLQYEISQQVLVGAQKTYRHNVPYDTGTYYAAALTGLKQTALFAAFDQKRVEHLAELIADQAMLLP